MRRSVSAALITLFALSPAAAGEPAPPDPSTRSAPGEESPTLGRLVSIPAGTFTMGSPSSEPGRSPDEGQVSVTLTTGFLLMETEVTQRQWRAVMGNNPSKSAPCRAFDAESLVGDDRPVSCVSWWDAVAFANKVSTRARLTPAYRVNGDTVTWDRAANGYRLPTEAEWEYAARAGANARFVGTSDEGAVCAEGNVGDATAKAKWAGLTAFSCRDGQAAVAPVRSFRANAWGLHDMVGNVWEWTWDWYADANAGGTDPTGAASGSRRVFRGGSWGDGPDQSRVAYRDYDVPARRASALGLRLSRSNP